MERSTNMKVNRRLNHGFSHANIADPPLAPFFSSMNEIALSPEVVAWAMRIKFPGSLLKVRICTPSFVENPIPFEVCISPKMNNEIGAKLVNTMTPRER